MKLRNKKTGAIYNIEDIDLGNNADGIWLGVTKYNSLAEFNEEWEDYKEPSKTIWQIKDSGELQDFEEDVFSDGYIESSKSIGNYFDTREEAEKAVEKLKAWKRLKDKGFRFDHIRSIDGVSIKYKDLDQYTIIAYADEDGCDQECLDLLFGGGE